MGTRGLAGVKSDGKLYGSYVHWDSYPEGLGSDIVDFCKELTEEKIVTLKEKFSQVIVVKDEEGDIKPTEEDKARYSEAGFYNSSVGGATPDLWYSLLRNLQGISYLEAILNGACNHWIDFIDFLKDSLFCEYAYIINLDNKTLEFYEGFNKEVDDNSPLPYEQVKCEEGYYPVRFRGSVALNAIPDDWIEKFYPKETE